MFLILPVLPAECRAEGLSLGLGYPYLSAKYDFKVLGAEGRFVSGSGVQVYAGRGYWNFHRSANLKGFAGLEGGYVKFNTLDTKGTGSEAALFVGGEYFVTKNISLLVDFAPTLISLKHGTYSDITASSIEYVVNLGFYLHFGGAQSDIKVSNAAPKAAVATAQNTAAPLLPAALPVALAKKETVSPEVSVWLAQLKSPDWKVRRKAAFELGRVKAVEAVVPLLELLDDENEKACGVAAMALGRIGDRRALSPLIERLDDESVYVRVSAAKALGSLRDRRAVNALRSALRDVSKEVRQAARAALLKLGSK